VGTPGFLKHAKTFGEGELEKKEKKIALKPFVNVRAAETTVKGNSKRED